MNCILNINDEKWRVNLFLFTILQYSESIRRMLKNKIQSEVRCKTIFSNIIKFKGLVVQFSLFNEKPSKCPQVS